MTLIAGFVGFLARYGGIRELDWEAPERRPAARQLQVRGEFALLSTRLSGRARSSRGVELIITDAGDGQGGEGLSAFSQLRHFFEAILAYHKAYGQ